jgi:hypothetical protein
MPGLYWEGATYRFLYRFRDFDSSYRVSRVQSAVQSDKCQDPIPLLLIPIVLLISFTILF